MISFKADLAGITTIKKVINNGQCLKDVDVNFVRLNPLASDDVLALKETCFEWGSNARIQSQKFDILNPKQILGLVQTSSITSDNIFIDLLQVSPEHKYNAPGASFKKIGASIVNSIKKLFPDKNILTCPATLAAELFYMKVGSRPFIGNGIMCLKR